MNSRDLHQWAVYARDGETLYVLDESDRFGPYVVVRERDDKAVLTNMSRDDAIMWIASRGEMHAVEALYLVRETVATWMTLRARRAWLLRSAKPAATDVGACGQ